jgi:hypothetical protein
LLENEVRGKAGRQKGMNKTHLMAFVLNQQTKDLMDCIPAEDLIEIREHTLRQIVDYTKKVNEENNMKNADDETKNMPATADMLTGRV